ncbi:MAG: mannitol dehydrogenase family protein [Proteobacteria bacterium]|nr:mannitol dehydrogenase family protein [Pseudomonadota bacterium]
MTEPHRLSRRTLSGLKPEIGRPGFDPARLATGVVHLGIGAFARAHLAAYTAPLLAAEPAWGILGVSLRRADTRDALAPQDWLYACATRDGAGEAIEIMGTLTGILVVPEAPAAVLHRLADPATRIVTLTVTEKGYCRNTASDALDEDDPAVRHDLAHPMAPTTVPGLLAAALAARRTAGVAPFAVLSCDNLAANGAVTRRVVSRLAALRDPDLGRFVAGEVAFPSCMVDRIVPATTPADRARIDAALGVADAWPVLCEPFRQWVIEDRFPLGRPAWEETGAELVADVRPYEDMKLRLLNASHSAIAYLGQLAGWPTVAAAVAEPALRAYIATLMAESATTLRLPAGVDLASYRHALLERFANPALHHRTAQIAMDGSQKLPQRLFAPALDRLRAGQRAPAIALAVAAWLRFLRGVAEDGVALALDDPQARRLRDAARAAGDDRALRDAVFALPDIVPPALAAAPFADDVLAALVELATHGVRRVLARRRDGTAVP